VGIRGLRCGTAKEAEWKGPLKHIFSAPLLRRLEGAGTVAFTFQGIGTSFLGKRDFRPDGSYVTTKWIVVLWLPCVPLKSLRVAPLGSEGTVFNSTDRFAVMGETRPHKRQVACVYLYAAGYALCFAGVLSTWALKRLAGLPGTTGLWLLAGIVVAPALLPWYLRRRGRRAALSETKPRSAE